MPHNSRLLTKGIKQGLLSRVANYIASVTKDSRFTPERSEGVKNLNHERSEGFKTSPECSEGFKFTQD